MLHGVDELAAKTAAAAAFVSVLSEGRADKVHSPSAVLRALVWHRWSVDFKQQVSSSCSGWGWMVRGVGLFTSQDAHELYHVLLTTLEEEAVS